ncbi:MAG: hypothetical protein Q9200_001017 [Gallowayella weberi]
MAEAYKAPKLPVQQLVILALCRLADPISFSSVFPYLPEMIESFNVPKDEVGRWAGILSAVFSFGQAATGILWGRASDRFGRKPVILTGMVCVMSTGLLFGFSQNLAMAVVARSLAGASNGNGGALANPASKYPSVFGNDFFRRFPYALPNIVASLFFFVGLGAGAFFLKESLESKKHRRDYGRKLGKSIVRAFRPKPRKRHLGDDQQSAPLLKQSRISSMSSNSDENNSRPIRKPIAQAPPTYREVFSGQSNINLVTYTLLALHSVAYDQLLPVFMHYPLQHNRASDANVSLPFKFSGGFGIDFLIFPPVARYYGVLNSLKVVTIMFPLVYLATPFTALLPDQLTQQIGIMLIMLIKCFAAIFAFPCTTILLTNSAVSLRILGTLNGVATSVSAIGRATGPAVSGVLFETGSKRGWAILPWWVLAGFAILGAIPVWWLVEMEGFGASEDDDEEEEDGTADQPEMLRAHGQTSEPEGILRDEGNNTATGNEEIPSTSNRLSKWSSSSSGAAIGSPLKKVSSPIGLKTFPGPGGNNLCNGLGHSRSGFGAGGTSYH